MLRARICIGRAVQLQNFFEREFARHFAVNHFSLFSYLPSKFGAALFARATQISVVYNSRIVDFYVSYKNTERVSVAFRVSLVSCFVAFLVTNTGLVYQYPGESGLVRFQSNKERYRNVEYNFYGFSNEINRREKRIPKERQFVPTEKRELLLVA